MNPFAEACPRCEPGMSDAALPGRDGIYKCSSCGLRWTTRRDRDGWLIDRTVLCACGAPATVKLYVHHKYPRAGWLPEAADPWNIHGGGESIEICEDPRCEPDALLACRVRIIDHSVLRPWPGSCGLSDEQIAGLELVATRGTEGLMGVFGGEDDD